MESQNPKSVWPVVLAIVITVFAVGGGMYWWQLQNTTEQPATITVSQNSQTTVTPTDNWKTYTSSNYEFRYPTGYTVEEPTSSFKALTVRGPNGRLEIFKTSDFAERPFGFTGEETQADIDGYVPKEFHLYGLGMPAYGPQTNNYEVWLFWPEGNSTVKNEIREIADTLQLK